MFPPLPQYNLISQFKRSSNKKRKLASSRKRSSIQLSKELASDLAEASAKVNVVLETLEVQLDKQTMRRLKLGEKEYQQGKYTVARTEAEIEKVLSKS